MASETLNELLRPGVFVLKLLWFAMTATILFFILVAYLITNQNQSSPVAVGSGLKIVIYVIAIGCAVVSFLLRRQWLSKLRADSTTVAGVDLTSLAADAETGQVDEARLAKVKSLRPDQAKLFVMTGRYFTAMILSLALREAITLCGMMLDIWEQKFESILPFAAFTLLLNLIAFPRLNHLIDRNAPMKAQFQRYWACAGCGKSLPTYACQRMPKPFILRRKTSLLGPLCANISYAIMTAALTVAVAGFSICSASRCLRGCQRQYCCHRRQPYCYHTRSPHYLPPRYFRSRC
jgi:hypothetical protein